ncbi:MAG TPA: peptidoglycan DD-metalloendopeptidase family protein [Pyrinomonadaceae bacterium]|nr:peptidoglycan DD-metalloendopeptidase family protein [Pyrinomonadaceae bacterium]
MPKKLFSACVCVFLMLTHGQAQQVLVMRDPGAEAVPKAQPVKAAAPKPEAVKAPMPKAQLDAAYVAGVSAAKVATAKPQPVIAQPAKAQPVTPSTANPPPAKKEIQVAQTRPAKQAPLSIATVSRQTHDSASNTPQPVSLRPETAFTKIADGFDFPVGKPDAQGYYKARGFRAHGHLGEDWDGVRGGDTDLGSPIHSIGDGIVVFSRDCHMGWGNVVIIRHIYREGGIIKNIDSLYGHLQTIQVRRGQAVARGQQIGTMGTAHGLYDAHLHLEIRKNIEIGMSRAAFAPDFSNYYDPSQFIASHRHLTSGGNYRVAMNTFARDARINFDRARNYSRSHHRGGSRESAAALKKAIAARSN